MDEYEDWYELFWDDDEDEYPHVMEETDDDR